MRVISRSLLKAFWTKAEFADSEGPLRAWYTHVSNRSIEWHTWSDVKAEIGSASKVGNCVVFNIGGNKYRMVTRVLYPSQKVFILKVMTHEEYDEDKWQSECGCYQPPPPKAKTLSKKSPAKNKRRGH